jgi:hypothetical protein
MVDKRDSEFISNYDSFAPPAEETAAYERRGSVAGKLLIFLLQLPSWIVAALFATVVYSQITHTPVSLGPLEISSSLNGAPAASAGPSGDEIQKLSQKIDELGNKLDALVAGRSVPPSEALAAPLGAQPPPSSASGAAPAAPVAVPPAAKSATAQNPATASKTAVASAKETAKTATPAAKGKALSSAVREDLNDAVSHGRELSTQITNYARQHGGTLGPARSNFVRESDQWLNTTYDLLEEKVGSGIAMNFMTAEPTSDEVAGVGDDDAHLIRSIQARVASLQRITGTSGNDGGDM